MLAQICGYWGSQIIFTAVKLGLPDAIAGGAQTVDALAARARANPERLLRLLRALVAIEILSADGKGRFRLTQQGKMLTSAHPRSLRDFALMIVDDWNWQTWAALPEAMVSDKPVFESVMGMPAWEYLRRNPEKEEVFAASMASISTGENDAIVASYPWDQLGSLVDVGGAHGHLLAAILGKAKKLKGILFDQPQVVELAAQSGYLAKPGIAKRVEIVGGSFFETIPAGADAYMMKHIIHDWNDEKSAAILRNCRDAMAPRGRVLVIDHVLRPNKAGEFGPLMDLNMLVGPDGKERTKEEFAELFARAGLRLKRIHPTPSRHSILEAVRA